MLHTVGHANVFCAVEPARDLASPGAISRLVRFLYRCAIAQVLVMLVAEGGHGLCNVFSRSRPPCLEQQCLGRSGQSSTAPESAFLSQIEKGLAFLCPCCKINVATDRKCQLAKRPDCLAQTFIEGTVEFRQGFSLSFDALEHALVATIARGQESTDLLLGHIAGCNRLVVIADLGLGRRYPIRQRPIRYPLFFVGADKPAKTRFFLFEYGQRKVGQICIRGNKAIGVCT